MLEAPEKRKRRDPEIRVWDWFVRIHHWLLVIAFATLYLESRKFPLHTYAGYCVTILISARVIWGFAGKGAARFSSFTFSPKQTLQYFKESCQGKGSYYLSHNPLGAAMVFALLSTLLLNCLLGMLAYSSSQELGPLRDLVPSDYEDLLIDLHSWLGHLIAALVIGHLAGVLWAARQHRENYIIAMITGKRRAPRTTAQTGNEDAPSASSQSMASRAVQPKRMKSRRPFLESLLLMLAIIFLIALPTMHFLASFNSRLLAY